MPNNKPFYLHMPSARPLVLKTLPLWFIHAVEARAGSNAGELVKTLEEQNEAYKERKRENGNGGNGKNGNGNGAEFIDKTRQTMLHYIKRRNIAGMGQFHGDIHFVVVDNSPFYTGFYSKKHPFGSGEQVTHTKQGLELSKALNEIGNKYGVFVHYITTRELGHIMPPIEEIKNNDRNDHPLFQTAANREVVTGPGAATNIALTYIAGYHADAYGKAGAHLMRFSDDVRPPMIEKTNFFLDAQPPLQSALKSAMSRTGSKIKTVISNANRKIPLPEKWSKNIRLWSAPYRGYADASGHAIEDAAAKGQKLYKFIIRTVRSPEDLPLYATSIKDVESVMPRGVKSTPTPQYLRHSGQKSLWNIKVPIPPNTPTKVLGNRGFNIKERVKRPTSEEFVPEVMKASGITGKPVANGNARRRR